MPAAPASAPDVVVVGCSAGGLAALSAILPALGRAYPLPVVVAQHRGRDERDETKGLAHYLAGVCRMPVVDAEDKLPLESGRVYLAPADYHLLVERHMLALSTEAPVNRARPSIDVLFESAAESYGPGVVGVLLTGASADGAVGLKRIGARGGLTVVQSPETAESAKMPTEAIRAAAPRHVLALPEIAQLLAGLKRG